MQLVEEYRNKYHKKTVCKDGDKISYTSRVYYYKEMVNLVDPSLEFWFTAGNYVNMFEKKLCRFFKNKILLAYEFRLICYVCSYDIIEDKTN